MKSFLCGLVRRLAAFHRDDRGAEGLEKVLILAAIVLPLLGLLIWFRDELAKWLREIWQDERQRAEQPTYYAD